MYNFYYWYKSVLLHFVVGSKNTTGFYHHLFILYYNYKGFIGKKITEKETQKGKMKNPKVQKPKRCENVKSNNRIIQKSKS